MKFERRHAVLLLAVAVWNVVTFGMFARNLWSAYESGEDRATGYWVAHSVLIVVNFVIAALLGSLGWKALRASLEALTAPGSLGGSAFADLLASGLQGGVEVPVEPGDHVEGDLLGARGGALADVGAATEALVVVLGDHVDHPAVPLGLALGQLAEVGDLGADEQRRRPVGAGGDAGAAADAGGGVEGAVRLVLRAPGSRGRRGRRRC